MGTGLLALGLFFALNPYILLEFDRFAAFQSDAERSIGGQILDQLLGKQGFGFFAEAALAYEPAITLLGIAGALLAVRRFPSTALLVLIYPLFHYLVFSAIPPSLEQRYILPALVLWALPAGLAGEGMLRWVRGLVWRPNPLSPFPAREGGTEVGTPPFPAAEKGIKGGAPPFPRGEGGPGGLGLLPTALIAVVFAAVVILPPVRYDWLLSQTDTRTLAKEWIEGNLPAGAEVAVESYPPPLTPDLDSLRAQQQAEPRSLGSRDQWLLERGLPPGQVSFRLVRLNLVDTSPREDRLSDYLANHRHRYFVVSDFRWKSDHLGHQALKAYLARNGRLLKAFPPSGDPGYVPSDVLNNMEDPPIELWKVGRPGPRIEIYEVR